MNVNAKAKEHSLGQSYVAHLLKWDGTYNTLSFNIYYNIISRYNEQLLVF